MTSYALVCSKEQDNSYIRCTRSDLGTVQQRWFAVLLWSCCTVCQRQVRHSTPPKVLPLPRAALGTMKPPTWCNYLNQGQMPSASGKGCQGQAWVSATLAGNTPFRQHVCTCPSMQQHGGVTNSAPVCRSLLLIAQQDASQAAWQAARILAHLISLEGCPVSLRSIVVASSSG